jgi:hypothetical protein
LNQNPCFKFQIKSAAQLALQPKQFLQPISFSLAFSTLAPEALAFSAQLRPPWVVSLVITPERHLLYPLNSYETDED